MLKRKPAAFFILAGMALGIVLGYMVFVNFPDKKSAAQVAGYISLFSDVFLRLIKMLIGPLVFSTLVVGIAHMGSAASVGRVFAKALGWFVTASLISLLLGLILANILQANEGYAQYLAGLWNAAAPTPGQLLEGVDAAVKTYDDDRTIVAIKLAP